MQLFQVSGVSRFHFMFVNTLLVNRPCSQNRFAVATFGTLSYFLQLDQVNICKIFMFWYAVLVNQTPSCARFAFTFSESGVRPLPINQTFSARPDLALATLSCFGTPINSNTLQVRPGFQLQHFHVFVTRSLTITRWARFSICNLFIFYVLDTLTHLLL